MESMSTNNKLENDIPSVPFNNLCDKMQATRSQEGRNDSTLPRSQCTVDLTIRARQALTLRIPEIKNHEAAPYSDISCVMNYFYTQIMQRYKEWEYDRPRDLTRAMPGRNFTFTFWPSSMHPDDYHQQASSTIIRFMRKNRNSIKTLPWGNKEMGFVLAREEV